MAIKLLENTGIENTGIGASALNNLITGNKNGIVGKYLNECAFTATGNTIIIDKGLLIICGRQVEIDAIESITLSSLPSEDVRYQIVIELIREESGEVTASIFARQPSTLIQENLLKDGFVYQFELGRVTHKTTGQVTEVLRTADILYGQSGAGADIEVGEVNTQMISTELPAEVNINKTVDSGKTKLNFDFSLPKPYEDSVTGLVYSSQIVGESVTINNTSDGYVDQITLEGNTIGGGGTPETPIAIQSVENPITLVSCGKNLFDPIQFLIDNDFVQEVTFDGKECYKWNAGFENNNLRILENLFAENTAYTLSGNFYLETSDSGSTRFGFVYKDGSNDRTPSFNRNVWQSISLTSNPEKTIAYINGENNSTARYVHLEKGTFQIEKGSTATEYEPYQGTNISIPIKDTNNNELTLRRAGTAYDSVYKENGKWYLRKAINEQVLNGSEDWSIASGRFYLLKDDAKMPVDAGTLPNLIATTHQTKTLDQILSGDNGVYLAIRLGIQDTVTFAGFTVADFKTWLSTYNMTIAYELATPEIIELHEDTATALESIKTFQGQTNIFGTNTVNPILDITELAMGIGEKKYALLTDGDGNAVMPATEADNVILSDGRTVEYAISNIDKIANVESGVIYDQVIRTQTDFETLIASPTWLDAKSVALVGQFVYNEPDNSGIKIPSTVKQIHGFNSAKITITNFVYNETTAKGGLWYDTLPTTLDYSICDLEVDCTGTGTLVCGFYFCTNLTNCTGTGTGTGTGAEGYGFSNCTNLTNCTGTGTGTYGVGFYFCTNLTNCTGTGTGIPGNGYGFRNGTNLTNCTGTGVGADGYGFYNITTASNCKDGGSTTDMWDGFNKNINVETCRKTPVNADNTTLNT